jgi:hypothetical protein
MKPWEQMTDEERKSYIDIAIEILGDLLSRTPTSNHRYGAIPNNNFRKASADNFIVNKTAFAIYEFHNKPKLRGE